jgi:hypothetical protein
VLAARLAEVLDQVAAGPGRGPVTPA